MAVKLLPYPQLYSINYTAMNSEEVECFQKTVYFGSVEAIIHINISEILAAINTGLYKNQITQDNLSEFTDADSIIDWEPIRKTLTAEKHKDDPIIIIPFRFDNYQFLVIDGNHRLSYYKQISQSKIPTITLHPQNLIDANLFVSEFDAALYIFLYELQTFGLLRKFRVQINDDVLVRQSFFYQGRLALFHDLLRIHNH